MFIFPLAKLFKEINKVNKKNFNLVNRLLQKRITKVHPGLLILFFLSFLKLSIFAQPFDIERIDLQINSDTLMVDVYFENLFEGEIRKTLLSGIPIQIDLIAQIKTADEITIFTRNISSLVTYDVWEEEFQITTYLGGKQSFLDFADLEDFYTPLKNLEIGNINQINSQPHVSFHLAAIVNLITEKESSKLKKWLESGEATEEDNPTGERDSGFKMNLSQLVSFFFNNQEKSQIFKAEKIIENIKLEQISRRP